MKLLECFLVFSAAFVVYSASAEDGLHDNSTTTVSPVSNTTVTESTTSTSNSTETTVSTPQTSTTPASNITTSPTEPSTTPAVVSTTTTESPGPADLMLVVNNSEVACIIAKMEITLTLVYENTNKTTVKGTFPITSAIVDSRKSSKCVRPAQEVDEKLYADFNENNTLYFLFNHTKADKFAVTLLELNSTDLQSLFPDAMENQSLFLQTNGSFFETSSNMSYKCNSETTVNLVDASGMATNSSIVFKKVQVEAFRTTNDTDFASAIDCEADEDIDNIIPIAVGCALAGLVVIVLIAYLVGRRQKRQRGYESV